MEQSGNFEPAYLAAREIFSRCDPLTVSSATGAAYYPHNRNYCLDYFGFSQQVDFPTGVIHSNGGNSLLPSDKVLLLRYLCNTASVPLAGLWQAFIELPGGPHHHRPFQRDALEPLAHSCGARYGSLRQAAAMMGGKSLSLGDEGMVIPALPMVPLGIIMWHGDDEFPPKANILFDSSAVHYLDTASLYMLGINASLRLQTLINS